MDRQDDNEKNYCSRRSARRHSASLRSRAGYTAVDGLNTIASTHPAGRPAEAHRIHTHEADQHHSKKLFSSRLRIALPLRPWLYVAICSQPRLANRRRGPKICVPGSRSAETPGTSSVGRPVRSWCSCCNPVVHLHVPVTSAFVHCTKLMPVISEDMLCCTTQRLRKIAATALKEGARAADAVDGVSMSLLTWDKPRPLVPCPACRAAITGWRAGGAPLRMTLVGAMLIAVGPISMTVYHAASTLLALFARRGRRIPRTITVYLFGFAPAGPLLLGAPPAPGRARLPRALLFGGAPRARAR